MRRISIFSIILFVAVYAGAQNTDMGLGTRSRAVASDTVRNVAFDESSLDQVPDIRTQFEKQNSTYAIPMPLSAGLQHLLKEEEEEELQMSEEALYWARLVRDSSTIFNEYMTFRDTIFVSPIYTTPIFRGKLLPDDLQFYHIDYPASDNPYAAICPPDSTFYKNYVQKKEAEESVLRYIEEHQLPHFRYSSNDLPGETVETKAIKKSIRENLPIKIERAMSPEDVDSPAKFIPDRRYWSSNFESKVQFSQNYVSPNWHKGGNSNLNLFTRNYLRYDYNRDKVQLANEIEIKASFYDAPKDTLRSYKLGDDLFRIHSNLGYKAFSKWYYTFDAEFKTQLFTNYQENTDNRQTAILSPFTINIGIGMKYDLVKAYKARNKRLQLSVNLAPLSCTYMYSIDHGLKMGLWRHGFKKRETPVEGENEYEYSLSRFGSTVKADMIMNFSRNINWQSRVYYFTSYEHVTAEFENTLNLAVTRHFSTSIYIHLRFDDSVKKTADFDSYFQLNELLSFGFNYKW
jgi:hypothetical protein